MNIRMVARHYELTEALKQYIEQKLERVIRHCNEVLDISVALSSQKSKEKSKHHHIEVIIRMRGIQIVAEQEHSDMYAAIDIITLKLDRQVTKHKAIKHTHYHDKHFAQEQMAAQAFEQVQAQ